MISNKSKNRDSSISKNRSYLTNEHIRNKSPKKGENSVNKSLNSSKRSVSPSIRFGNRTDYSGFLIK